MSADGARARVDAPSGSEAAEPGSDALTSQPSLGLDKMPTLPLPTMQSATEEEDEGYDAFYDEKEKAAAAAVISSPPRPAAVVVRPCRPSWKHSFYSLGRSGARVLGIQSEAERKRARNYDRNISRAVKRRKRNGLRTKILLFLVRTPQPPAAPHPPPR